MAMKSYHLKKGKLIPPGYMKTAAHKTSFSTSENMYTFFRKHEWNTDKTYCLNTSLLFALEKKSREKHHFTSFIRSNNEKKMFENSIRNKCIPLSLPKLNPILDSPWQKFAIIIIFLSPSQFAAQLVAIAETKLIFSLMSVSLFFLVLVLLLLFLSHTRLASCVWGKIS